MKPALLSPERRTGLYFFSQFMSGGAANAYGGIWLAQQSLTTFQIGLVNAIPILIVLLTNLLVGRIADRARDWQQVIIAGALRSGLFPIGLFRSEGFVPILLFWAGAAVAQSLIVPVADAAAMHLTLARGGSFGTIRSLATIGYMLAVPMTGYAVHWFGPIVFLPLFAGLAMLRGLASLALPHFKAHVRTMQGSSGHTLRSFLRPWFSLPLLGWSIVYATHYVLNGFQSLLWAQQGISNQTIGLLIATGALSEAVMFFAYRLIPERTPLLWLILASGAVTVIRWFCMIFEPSVLLLFPLQLLRGITFAMGFLACTNFIRRNAPISVAAEAQSFFFVIQQLAGVAVILIFSRLAGVHGDIAFFGNAIMALIGTLIVAIAFRIQSCEKAVSEPQ